VFHSAEDAVDGAHQKVRINFHAGTASRDAAGAVKTKKLPGIVSGVIISSVTDVKTASQNNLLTPGRNIKVSGSKLKITGYDPTRESWLAQQIEIGAEANGVKPEDYAREIEAGIKTGAKARFYLTKP
jgi:hypothetical protein